MSDSGDTAVVHEREAVTPQGPGDEILPQLDEETRERRRAALANVRTFGDPVLKSRASGVRSFGSELEREAERMVSIMRDALGVGLAATQLGIMRRLLVFQATPNATPSAIVNPELDWLSEERAIAEEGCLSLPGISVEVERPLYARERPTARTPRRRRAQRSGEDPPSGLAHVRSPPRPLALRTVYLGTSEFAVAVLRRLAGSPHRPALVVTPPDRPKGRGRRLASPPAAAAAREMELELLQTESVNRPEAVELISAAEPELGVVCAFGQLIKDPLLSELEMLNVHPSLIPRWRGAAPIERAIMAGDLETGVTIMRVTEGLDSGPVGLQE